MIGAPQDTHISKRVPRIAASNKGSAGKTALRKYLQSSEYPDPTTEVLSQRFYRTFGKIGSTVYKREQNTVDCQVPIGVLLHLGNR